MTTFPSSPRLQKGAIIGLDPFNPLASVIVFQYNPDTMTRTLTAQATGGDGAGDRGEALRLKGPPQEQIKLDVEIDAAWTWVPPCWRRMAARSSWPPRRGPSRSARR